MGAAEQWRELAMGAKRGHMKHLTVLLLLITSAALGKDEIEALVHYYASRHPQ